METSAFLKDWTSHGSAPLIVGKPSHVPFGAPIPISTRADEWPGTPLIYDGLPIGGSSYSTEPYRTIGLEMIPAEFVVNSVDVSLSAFSTVVSIVTAPEDDHLHHWPSSEFELANATLALDTSALTSLIRAFDDSNKDWSAYSVLDGQHRILAKKHAWYRDWSSYALVAAFLGASREKFAELLRDARKKRRSAGSRNSRLLPTVIDRVHSQLERLANFISPNAPPTASVTGVRAGVGVI